MSPMTACDRIVYLHVVSMELLILKSSTLTVFWPSPLQNLHQVLLLSQAIATCTAFNLKLTSLLIMSVG